MKRQKTPAPRRAGTATKQEQREIVSMMRRLKATNPDGYRAFVALIREVEKISPIR